MEVIHKAAKAKQARGFASRAGDTVQEIAARKNTSDELECYADVLRLQRTAGNRAVERLYSHGKREASEKTVAQAKLALSEPGDKCEREADDIARQVVNDLKAQRLPATMSSEDVDEEELCRNASPINSIFSRKMPIMRPTKENAPFDLFERDFGSKAFGVNQNILLKKEKNLQGFQGARELSDTKLSHAVQSKVAPSSIVVQRVAHNIFEENPKHGSSQKGRANPAPKNPQKSLDSSIELPGNTTRRIAVDNIANEFVVFDEHLPGKFHGHSRKWRELNQTMQSLLKKAGLVTKKGKIK